jgi:hypothetical protein
VERAIVTEFQFLRSRHGRSPHRFLAGHTLVGVFQTGWTVLHEEICMSTNRQIAAVREFMLSLPEVLRL